MTLKSESNAIIMREFRSTPEIVEEVENLTDQVSQKLRFNEQDRDSIAIAVTEAVNNAILHGNKNDESKKVFLEIYANSKDVLFVIRDQGTGFNPTNVPDPLDPDNLLKEHGRGIFILKSLMDDVGYDFSSGGTEIQMRKKRP